MIIIGIFLVIVGVALYIFGISGAEYTKISKLGAGKYFRLIGSGSTILVLFSVAAIAVMIVASKYFDVAFDTGSFFLLVGTGIGAGLGFVTIPLVLDTLFLTLFGLALILPEQMLEKLLDVITSIPGVIIFAIVLFFTASRVADD